MMKANIKTDKRCAFCKYWYDPTQECITPKSGNNWWEYEPTKKRKCLKLNIDKIANASCNKYECKLPIV